MRCVCDCAATHQLAHQTTRQQANVAGVAGAAIVVNGFFEHEHSEKMSYYRALQWRQQKHNERGCVLLVFPRFLLHDVCWLLLLLVLLTLPPSSR